VEKDDRQMYRFDTQTAKEQTQCDRSEFLDELSTQEFRRMLTYGEVSVASITETVLPLLQLEEDDIFYDLGCGTGKIVVQAALETPCRIAKGIELMQNRVIEGAKALQILNEEFPELVEEKNIVIVQGDICKPPQEAPMMDATVVFINNVCFGPELMLKVMDMLSQMKNLRRVVTLRKICERHRDQKCFRAGNPCMEYVHPPFEAEIHVSWAHKTSVYLYERLAAFEANCQ
jgi:precorrin-6B methylase 2